MRIAIFGGLGFAGFSLGTYLKRKYSDYEIYLYDNLSRRGTEINAMLYKEKELSFSHCDIRCKEDLNEVTCDILIDASADASVLSGLTNGARNVIDINFIGSLNLIELVQRLKAKFIFLSTSRVYSIDRLNEIQLSLSKSSYIADKDQILEGVSPKGISEIFSTNGHKSVYGATKYCVEQILSEYIIYLGLDAIINRFGVLAGPGQFGRIDQGILMYWLINHYWNRSLSYIGFGGKGYQVRDFLHVFDFCKAIDIQIHQFQKFSGQLFNIGGGIKNSASLAELTSLAQKFTDRNIPIGEVLEGRSADIPWYITDYTKFKELSGWSPRKDLNSIFSDSFLWLKENETQLKKILG